MKVLPTLTLQNGRVVSAQDGSPATDRSAMDVIQILLDQGCCRFSLLDLDAARNQGCNRELIGQLLKQIRQSSSKVCVLVGGGICSSDHAQHFVNLGATWLLVDKAIHRYPVVVDQLMARFRDHLMGAIDSKGSAPLIPGRGEPNPVSIAEDLQDRGFKRLVFEDVTTEGTSDPDFATAKELCDRVKVPVFMAGSLRTQVHLAQAEEVRGLQGVFFDALNLIDSSATTNLPSSPCA